MKNLIGIVVSMFLGFLIVEIALSVININSRTEPPQDPNAMYVETTVNSDGRSAARLGVLTYRGKQHVFLRQYQNGFIKVGEYPIESEVSK